MKALSYASGISQYPLMGMTIGEKFDEVVELYSENEALIVHHQNIRWTYKQLHDRVTDCAKALLSINVKKGDRVGIWSANCAEWTVLQFATAKVGAILVNINPAYRIHELEYSLKQSECSVLVIGEKFKTSDYQSMILELAPELIPGSTGGLKSAKLPHLKIIISLSQSPARGIISWPVFLQKSKGCSETILQNREIELSFDDPINIQYTSGTTGFPKGATLSHHNILNNAYFTAKTMNFTSSEKLVIPVPLYHCFGMALGNLGCMTHGATMIYPSKVFDALAVLQAIQKEKATALFGVPTMFIAELEHPDFKNYNLSSLRTGIMAGAPCPVEVMKKVHLLMHMNEIQIAYGMTETSPVCTQTNIGTSFEKQISTVGQVHPHQEIKIIDPKTGITVPIGTPGELCVRGYSVMLGYWKNDKKTSASIDTARWMHTEDIATMDKEGYVNIVGRIKDMIIRGGENIYPKEIEEFLFTNPKISEVQVIGIPDPKYGEELMAWVKLKEGEKASAEEIKEFCNGKIAHFKIPKHIRFTQEFPMTVTGKVRKIEMREISVKELNLSIL